MVPTPSTPPGEPGPDPEPEATGSDPNAGGADGLGGSMGVSSERVPDEPHSIEGTGSRGTATTRASGTWPTVENQHPHFLRDGAPVKVGSVVIELL